MSEKLPTNTSSTTTTTTAAAANASTVGDAFSGDENSLDPFGLWANMVFDEEDNPFSFLHDPFSFPVLLENDNNGGFDEEFQNFSDKPFFPTPISSFTEGLSTYQQQQEINTSTVSPMSSSPFPSSLSREPNEQPTQQAYHAHQVLQQQQQPVIQQQQLQKPKKTSSVIPLRPRTLSLAPLANKKSDVMISLMSSSRKTPIKKMVYQFTYEQMLKDTWCWRKYGQKPIKGSPYPRNYFRCNDTKGCGARKQTERCNTDPNIYFVSYTGEHTHPLPTNNNRNSPGGTRHKLSRTNQMIPVTITPLPPPPSPPAVVVNDARSFPLAATCQSPTAPPGPADEGLIEEADNNNKKGNEGFIEEEVDVGDLLEDLLIPNLRASAIYEDFFEELTMVNNTTTTDAADAGCGGNEDLAATSAIDEDFFEGLNLFDPNAASSSGLGNED